MDKNIYEQFIDEVLTVDPEDERMRMSSRELWDAWMAWLPKKKWPGQMQPICQALTKRGVRRFVTAKKNIAYRGYIGIALKEKARIEAA